MGSVQHHWDVGIDLTERSHGPIVFAHWLATKSTAGEQMRGVFVGTKDSIRHAHPGAGAPLERARKLVGASVEALGADAAFTAHEVVAERRPEEELARLAEEANVDGLIIGRAAPVEGWSLISLGRVARRLLRRLPCPVVVVPPDLDREALAKGPIIVGVEPDDTAVAPARFARDLGKRLDLEVVLVHVLPDPNVAPLPTVGTGQQAPQVDIDRLRASATDALRRWAAQHDLSDLPLHVEGGLPGPGLLEAADSLGATMIVCGSRQLSLGARVFQSSTASEVAAHAPRPVAVVAT